MKLHQLRPVASRFSELLDWRLSCLSQWSESEIQSVPSKRSSLSGLGQSRTQCLLDAHICQGPVTGLLDSWLVKGSLTGSSGHLAFGIPLAAPGAVNPNSAPDFCTPHLLLFGHDLETGVAEWRWRTNGFLSRCHRGR